MFTNEITDIWTLLTDTLHFCIKFLLEVLMLVDQVDCNAENTLLNNKFQFLVDYHDMERAVAPMVSLVVAFRVNFK